MSVPIFTQRDIAEQLRYHYMCYRQIDQTIKALERFQRLRETETPAAKAIRRKSRRAA